VINLSSDGSIQETIRAVRELFTKGEIEEGLKTLEKKTIDLERNDKYLESLIIWKFLADTAEQLEESDILSYAYAKMITRYLYIDEVEKAKDIYDIANARELDGFHIDTAKILYEKRTQKLMKREIIEIEKRDIFGDYVTILGCPNILFDSLTQIKQYIADGLEEGTYIVKVYNHNVETIEDFEISTEKTLEYQVLSINERVKIGL